MANNINNQSANDIYPLGTLRINEKPKDTLRIQEKPKDTLRIEERPKDTLRITPEDTPKPRIIISERKAIEDINRIRAEAERIFQELELKKKEAGTYQAPVSIVDYLASQGRPSDFASRQAMAEGFGIRDYIGSAAQNLRMLEILQKQPPPRIKTQQELRDEYELERDKKRDDLLTGAIKDKLGEGEAPPPTPPTPPPTPTPLTPPPAPRIGFTPQQYEAQPFWRRPDETLEEYNERISVLQTPEDRGELPEPDLGISDELRDILNDIRKDREDLDDKYTFYQGEFDKLKRGDIPFTADEQAQLDNINYVFDDLRELQITANKNFEKATEIAGISGGRQRYAPEIHIGNVAKVVNTGIKKIREIEQDRLSTLSSLRQAISDKNYTRMADEYERFEKYSENKTKSILDMYDRIKEAEDDIRDFTYKQEQDNIDNILKAKRLDMETKDKEIRRILDQAKFDETKINNLRDYAIAQRKLALEEAEFAEKYEKGSRVVEVDEIKDLLEIYPDTEIIFGMTEDEVNRAILQTPLSEDEVLFYQTNDPALNINFNDTIESRNQKRDLADTLVMLKQAGVSVSLKALIDKYTALYPDEISSIAKGVGYEFEPAVEVSLAPEMKGEVEKPTEKPTQEQIEERERGTYDDILNLIGGKEYKMDELDKLFPRDETKGDIFTDNLFNILF